MLSCLPPWGKFRLGSRDGSRRLLGLQTVPSASSFCARAWAGALSSRLGSQPSLLLQPPPSRSRRLGSCPALPTWDTRRELSTAAVQCCFLCKAAPLPARLPGSLLGVTSSPRFQSPAWAQGGTNCPGGLFLGHWIGGLSCLGRLSPFRGKLIGFIEPEAGMALEHLVGHEVPSGYLCTGPRGSALLGPRCQNGSPCPASIWRC